MHRLVNLLLVQLQLQINLSQMRANFGYKRFSHDMPFLKVLQIFVIMNIVGFLVWSIQSSLLFIFLLFLKGRSPSPITIIKLQPVPKNWQPTVISCYNDYYLVSVAFKIALCVWSHKHAWYAASRHMSQVEVHNRECTHRF